MSDRDTERHFLEGLDERTERERMEAAGREQGGCCTELRMAVAELLGNEDAALGDWEYVSAAAFDKLACVAAYTCPGLPVEQQEQVREALREALIWADPGWEELNGEGQQAAERARTQIQAALALLAGEGQEEAKP